MPLQPVTVTRAYHSLWSVCVFCLFFFFFFPLSCACWDAFHVPCRYYHRNRATEFNGIVSIDEPYSGFDAGVCFLTPMMTPHGVSAATTEGCVVVSRIAKCCLLCTFAWASTYVPSSMPFYWHWCWNFHLTWNSNWQHRTLVRRGQTLTHICHGLTVLLLYHTGTIQYMHRFNTAVANDAPGLNDPKRLSEESIWFMFESCQQMAVTKWAQANTSFRDVQYRQFWAGLERLDAQGKLPDGRVLGGPPGIH